MTTKLTKNIAQLFTEFLSHSAAAVSRAKDAEGINIFLSGRRSRHRVILMNAAKAVIGDEYRLTGSLSVNKRDDEGNMLNVEVLSKELVDRTEGNWWSIPIVEMPSGVSARKYAEKLRESEVPALSLDEAVEICGAEAKPVLQAIADQKSETRDFQAQLFGAKPRYDFSRILVLLSPSGAPTSDAFWTNERDKTEDKVTSGMDAAMGKTKEE